ncbi:VWA domain-containing protein [Aquabacter sp. CN5-332]|uniref:vWA domain-containing protein n=1 Tax=Aquabacter sp. CN5-332 TaxID=3156608 RepID=UPI0032B3E90E
MNAALHMGPEGIGGALRLRLAGFVRTLRDSGFKVGLAESRDALAFLASPLALRRATLQPGLKALFCADRSDWARFDEVFSAYWTGHGVRSVQKVSGSAGKTRALERAPSPGARGEGLPDHTERREGDAETARGGSRREGASRAELITATDIRHIADPDETARVHELTARLARRMQARLVRRARARASGQRLDLRRTIHRSIPRGGTPVDLVWRRRKRKPLRIVALLDASGSMSLYTAFFVRFLHGLVTSFREADVFLFHTRLVHVSPSLRDRNVARAVDRLALMAQGIGGGTKIGESLADFNRWHAKRMLHARTALLIVSDGYDTGAPTALAAEMRRLRRRCRRIVWLNPLIGWRDYAPEARGMKAALPYIDLFAPAHNLESLAALEPYLARI